MTQSEGVISGSSWSDENVTCMNTCPTTPVECMDGETMLTSVRREVHVHV